MNLKYLSLCTFLLLGAGGIKNDGRTFYTYPSKESLSPNPNLSAITLAFLFSLEENSDHLIQQRANAKETPSRIRAYLYSAAYDFGHLTGGKGDIETLSHETLRIFFPDLPQKNFADPISEEIGNRVLRVYQARYQAEEKRLHPASIRQGDKFWKPKGEASGLYEASATPWYIESIKAIAFRPLPAPDNNYWENQIEQLKGAKEEEVLLNSRLAWHSLLKEAAKIAQTDPLTYLYQRAVLARALQDTSIIVFEGKYKVGAKRPDSFSQSIATKVPVPSHPSYPSLFSALGATASTLLDSFYPEQKGKWDRLAEQSGKSRVAAGLHFLIDHEEGVRIGQLVGQKALREEQS